jgi:hypothetical protein
LRRSDSHPRGVPSAARQWRRGALCDVEVEGSRSVGYWFDNEAFRIGALAGLSLFTRRGG